MPQFSPHYAPFSIYKRIMPFSEVDSSVEIELVKNIILGKIVDKDIILDCLEKFSIAKWAFYIASAFFLDKSFEPTSTKKIIENYIEKISTQYKNIENNKEALYFFLTLLAQTPNGERLGYSFKDKIYPDLIPIWIVYELKMESKIFNILLNSEFKNFKDIEVFGGEVSFFNINNFNRKLHVNNGLKKDITSITKNKDIKLNLLEYETYLSLLATNGNKEFKNSNLALKIKKEFHDLTINYENIANRLVYTNAKLHPCIYKHLNNGFNELHTQKINTSFIKNKNILGMDFLLKNPTFKNYAILTLLEKSLNNFIRVYKENDQILLKVPTNESVTGLENFITEYEKYIPDSRQYVIDFFNKRAKNSKSQENKNIYESILISLSLTEIELPKKQKMKI